MQFNYIANASLPSLSGRTLAILDPSDGLPYDEIQRSNAADVDYTVRAARQGLDAVWCKFNAGERANLLMRLSQKITEHLQELTDIEQRDCGKPTRQARADAQTLARYFEFYAKACLTLQDETTPNPEDDSLLTWHEPHGVTAHIIPWNYPMQIFGRSVGAALAAGNVCVIKPAEDACLSLLRVAQLAAEVGFPAGVINIVTGYGHEVGDALVRHPGIDHISFTGSPHVGTLIQQVAAQRHCPVMLAIGGKSPQIIFADADLDAAIPAIINAMIQNAGQTSSAGSRLLIDETIYEPLLARLGLAFENLRVGPAAMDLDLGPLIRQQQQQHIWDFLSDAQVANITMVAQGKVVDDAPQTGFYQAPTLLRDVPVTHRLAQEDVYGPVLIAMSFRDEDHAVELANAIPFGLVAGIWTTEASRQLRVARRIRCGQVFINNYGAGGGMELPFDGVNLTTSGRRKGLDALRGFTIRKTIAVKTSPQPVK